MHLATGLPHRELVDGDMQDEVRNKKHAEELLEAGFTTREKRLEKLKKGDYKKIVIASNKKAIDYE